MKIVCIYLLFRNERLEERLKGHKDESSRESGENLEDKIYNLEIQLINEKQKASHAINKHSKVAI